MRSVPVSALAPMLVVLCVSHAAQAQAQASPTPVESRTRLHADFEVDPTAYIFDGYSLHAGIGWKRLRVDLGAYAMRIPEAIHGQEGYDVHFDGFGVKLQLFPFAEQSGLVIGVDSGLARVLIRRENTQLAERDRQVAFGLNLGYRIRIVHGFYVTPWVGVSRSFGTEDVRLGGSIYESNPWLVFPAVHLGYQIL